MSGILFFIFASCHPLNALNGLEIEQILGICRRDQYITGEVVFSSWRIFPLLSIHPIICTVIRLKKNTLSQSLREFFKPTRHAVFNFLFNFFFTSIGLCLHAHPKPKMTEKFQLPYFQKSNRILHVFWAPTCLNSSKTANFLRFS